MIAMVRRTAEELVSLIRKRLVGRYASVPITIERSGSSWVAIIHVESDVTRERIERASKLIARYNDLA